MWSSCEPGLDRAKIGPTFLPDGQGRDIWKKCPRTTIRRPTSRRSCRSGSTAATTSVVRAWATAPSPFRLPTLPASFTWVTLPTTPSRTPSFVWPACAASPRAGCSEPITPVSPRRPRSTRSSRARASAAWRSVAISLSTPAGTGPTSTAASSSSRLSAWVAPSTSTTSASPWTRITHRPCARSSAIGTTTA